MANSNNSKANPSSFRPLEPYHIPGYCGYCPQFKYKIRNTFGKTTNELLSASDIKRSTHTVLAPLDDKDRQIRRAEKERGLIQKRGENLGDRKYEVQMVPCYTGYIPKSQHYFGERYAAATRHAIAKLEEEQGGYREKMAKEAARENPTSLRPIIVKTKMYFPKGIQHSLSPYTMKNDHPDKFFIAGFSGFVPRAREYIGMRYPIITNRALCKFNENMDEIKHNGNKPVVVDRPRTKIQDAKPLYNSELGMVPHYTGHVPGEKIRYGMTFGNSTKGAVQRAANS